MVTEIREYGDKTIVIYTEDRELAANLINRKRLIKFVPYEQGLDMRLVGMDFYFPKKELGKLEKLIGSAT